MKKAPRIPKDHREPTDPHLLPMQEALDGESPGVKRIFLLVDERGLHMVAHGYLPGYLQQQARDAMVWYAVEERNPHLKGKTYPSGDQTGGHPVGVGE